MKRLAGKKVIVTGASKGIGKGIARHFAQQGATLALCSRSAADIDAVGAELKALGATSVYTAACDIGVKAELHRFIADSAAHMGGVDALINNACYIADPTPLEHYDDAMFENSLTSGLTAVYQAMRAAFPFLRASGAGRIVNFSSIGGLRGVRGQAGYAAAKTGLIGLTRVAAAEWARFGITANCVAPMAMSDAWQSHLDTLPAGINPFHAVGVHSNAFGRPGDAEHEIAPAIAFLCSDDARFITGSVLPVDGGLLDLE